MKLVIASLMTTRLFNTSPHTRLALAIALAIPTLYDCGSLTLNTDLYPALEAWDLE